VRHGRLREPREGRPSPGLINFVRQAVGRYLRGAATCTGAYYILASSSTRRPTRGLEARTIWVMVSWIISSRVIGSLAAERRQANA
jgi:hypothetical protein